MIFPLYKNVAQFVRVLQYYEVSVLIQLTLRNILNILLIHTSSLPIIYSVIYMFRMFNAKVFLSKLRCFPAMIIDVVFGLK